MKRLYEKYFEWRDRLQQNRLLAGVISLGWLIAFVFAIKTSVLDANNIPSPSMEPTLMIGDFLFVNKMRYTFDLPYTNIHLVRIAYPERGDIVTFTPPQDSASVMGKTLVKRVIGIPGDRVEINEHEITISGTKYIVTKAENQALQKTLDDGKTAEREELFLEKIIDPKTGKLVVEHYIQKNRERSHYSLTMMPTPQRVWKIPAGKYLMMGDNRDHSMDGRACDMVEMKYRDQCQEFNRCKLNPQLGCDGDAVYRRNEGSTWGLIDVNMIHGKVYLSYLSVNWGTGTHSELNPIVNLFKTITGEFKGVYVRWERTFKRIY